MSVEEMKKKIVEQVNALNDQQLIEVQLFIDRINKLPVNEINLSQYVNQIITERSDVLKRLAQ